MAEEILAHDYDAIKRREYYLKNRKLKGRHPGAARTLKPRSKTVKSPVQTRAQRQAARRKKIEAQVAALKGRLERLRAVLAEEVKKAQSKSGATSSKAPAKSAAKTPEKKLTAAQKAKAAKAAEDYRKKNPDKVLADEVKSLTAKIKTIQERITKMRKTK